MEFSQEDLDLVRNSELFDAQWYLEQYPDVGMLGMDPAEHFLWLGKQLMRNPSPKFYMRDYLEANPDIAEASVHPFIHYEKIGRREGPYAGAVPERYSETGATACKRDIVRCHKDWNYESERKFLSRMEVCPFDVLQETVSIIMSTRNRADYIGGAIESVIKQDHRNWELIIVDDGGTDDTALVVRSFNDSRIRLVPNLAGAGVSSARNFGMRAARNKWICFLDPDSRWYPHFLTTMLRFLHAHGLDTAYAGAHLLDDSGQPWAVLFSEFDMETCLAENFITLNAFCVRRSLVGSGFDESLRRLVDWDFMLRIAAKARLLGAPFIGVKYYDGSGHGHISRSEYTEKSQSCEPIANIRDRVKSHILDMDRPIHVGQGMRIAVVFHVYHKHIINECVSYIRNIDHPFDLYITTSHEIDDPVIESLRNQFNDAVILRYDNIGSDIGPFIELMSTLCNYDLVCKLHTKRDVHRWKGAWRQYPLQAILGSKSIVNNIINCFMRSPDIIASGPAEFYKSGELNSIPPTMRHVRRLAKKTGFYGHLAKSWGFFAGTMFWMRPQALIGMARYICDTPSYNDHVREDGGPEHALERLLGISLLENPNAKVALTKVNIGCDVVIEVVSAQNGHCAEGVAPSLDRITADFDQHGSELGKPWLDVVSCNWISSADARKSRKHAEPACQVTAFIPTYNQEAFIGRAIESALTQNRDFGYEILISDDGSMDGTANVIEQYRARYPNLIRSIGDGVNRGISGNFKRGFEQAQGKYVAVLDGGDYWTDRDKLRKQERFLEGHESHSMVFSKILVHDLQRDVKSTLPRQDNIVGDTLTGMDFMNDPDMDLIASFSCCLFRADVMRDAPELIYENRINEIGVAFYLEKVGPIGFIHDVMSVHERHARGVWTGGGRKAQLENGLRVRRIAKILADAQYHGGIDKVIEEKFIKPLSTLV